MTPNDPIAAVAAIPELLEQILISLPRDDPRHMASLFAWTRAAIPFYQLNKKSVQLRHHLYLLDERSANPTLPDKPDGIGVCSHDVLLRANPLLYQVLPGFKELTVDFDNSQDHNGDGTCRRWHFAMELDPTAASIWRDSVASTSSWQSLLLSQPACRGITISCMERDGNGGNMEHISYDDAREHLYVAGGVTLGHIRDACLRAVDAIGHEDFCLYVDKDEQE